MKTRFVLLSILLAMVVASHAFASDFKSPHRLRPGEVLSADIINELFDIIEDNTRAVTPDELVGSWACRQYLVPATLGFEPAVSVPGAVYGPDNLYATRDDTVTFVDDGDGTYSFYTQTYSMLYFTYAVTTDTGVYTTYNNSFRFARLDGNNDGAGRIVKKGDSRFVIDFSNSSSLVCDKLGVTPEIPEEAAAECDGLQVTLNWKDRSDDETGFAIMRRDSLTGSYVQVDVTSANQTSYADTLPQAGIYWYRVQALNQYGNSLGSNVVKVDLP